jgi:RimJ/RimL family protein N-acetyltransferase
MNFDPRPVLLTGRLVRLEPLTPAHADALWEAGRDPAIFRYVLGAPFGGLDDVRRAIDAALEAQRNGAEVAWATVRLADGAVVGSTRYLDIRRPHRALEIGNTWLTPSAQRTMVNTEAKYLQLRHAFEELGAVRVQLKTDRRNEASRRAIARLGAVEEGTLRCYQTRHDGYVRDTVMFSLIAAEWPAAKAQLESRLLR